MDNKENLPEHLKQEVKEAEKEAVARMEIEYELRNNIAYKEFFSMYHPDDIEEFIKAYARRKVTWMHWGKYYYTHNQEHQLRFYNKAQDCLWQIQQKKLFNLQCQWRAERIKIPGISCTTDFRFWEYNIKQCSFMPAITHWEFEMYMDYFRSEESEIDPAEYDFEFEWQDYSRMAENINSNKESISIAIPLWYRFYDNRMGTGTLLCLPDLRGEKENKYLKAYYEYVNNEENKSHLSVQPSAQDENNYLSVYNPVVVEKFVRLYEDKEILRYFLSYEKSHKQLDFDDEMAEVAFKELREINETIAIKEGTDWRDSLVQTWEAYRRKQIVNILPLVYDEYVMKQDLSIFYDKERDIKELKADMEKWRDAILKGRELLAEPKDFNF